VIVESALFLIESNHKVSDSEDQGIENIGEVPADRKPRGDGAAIGADYFQAQNHLARSCTITSQKET